MKEDIKNCEESCGISNKVVAIYILNSNDCIFKNGTFIRMKRKYGKHERIVNYILPKEEDERGY